MTDIRPQYHFRPGPLGLRAWDVRRLVRLSADLPVIEVSPAAIVAAEEDWWYGHGEAATLTSVIEHMRLVRDADLAYPVLLAADGRLMDGMHRVVKAVLEGRETIPARRFDVSPDPDHENADRKTLPY